MDTLKAKPWYGRHLYAGNPDWIVEPYKIAEPLRLAGIDRADGPLNVSTSN
ncbi:Glucanase OS=Streptomyces microflavus OX=1919 GN=Smic_57750 PE=3 SV=1 [Streptomyces microflavus]